MAETTVPKHSGRGPRLFALAMPARPELFPFNDRAAEFYRKCGYTGIYIENDYPRFGLPATFGCWRGVNEVISLWRFSKDDSAQQYLEWISTQADIAHRNGLKLYLKIWEPRVPVSCREQITSDARAGRPENNDKGPPPNVCLMAPAGRRLIREFHEKALLQLDMIDGIVVGVADNWAELCTDQCPRCANVPLQDRIIQYFELFREVAATTRPNLDVIFYDWLWEEQGYSANNLVNRYLSTTDASVRVVTRFTQWVRQELPNCSCPSRGILDCTLSVDGPGPVTESYLPWVKKKRLRILDMLPVANSCEAWAHPPVPAPQVFLGRLKSLEQLGFQGFIDFDCGTLTPGIVAEAISRYMNADSIPETEELLDQLADETYGQAAGSTARQGWSACEEALRAYPLDMDSKITSVLVGRMGFSMAMTIGMVPDIRLFAGKDYGSDPTIIYPYSVLVPDVIEVQESQLSLVVDSMTLAADLLARAAELTDAHNKSFAVQEASRALALALMYRSQHNWAGMAKRLYSGQATAPPDEPGWVREALLMELDVTTRYKYLFEADRMLFSNPTWDTIGIIQLCDPERNIDRERPFDDKIAILKHRLHLN